MKGLLHNSKLLTAVFLLLSLFFVGSAFGQTTYYLTTAGANAPQTASSWNTGGITGGGTAATVFTGANDIFIISSGTTANYPANVSSTISGTLQVDGLIVIGTNTNGTTTTLTLNGAVLFNSATNQVTFGDSGASGLNSLVLGANATLKTKNTTGILGANCSITLNGSKTAATLPITASYEFNGTSAQATLGLPASVANLTINNAAGVTLTAALTIPNTRTLMLSSGIFASTTRLTMASTSSIVRSGGSITGTFQGTGIYNVSYTGNSKTTGIELLNGGLNNLTVNLTPGQTLTLDANRSPDGNLAISSGTFDLSTFTINRSAAGGTLTVSNGAALKIGGTNAFPANYSAHAIGGTSTVEYSGTAQTVAILNSSQSYGHLIFSGAGTKTLPSGTLAIAGDWTVGSTTTGNTNNPTINLTGNFALNSGTFTSTSSVFSVGGNWTNNGTFTSGTGTVNFNGTNQSLTGATIFNNLLLSNGGIKTFNTAITVNSNLSIANSTKASLGAGLTHSTATLALGSLGVSNGSWGSSTSPATNTNNTYFDNSTNGIINVASSSCSISITPDVIAAVCEGSTSFAIPFTATTGSPDQYSISGVGITTVTNGLLDASPITVILDAPANPGTISFMLTVSNSITKCVSSVINSSVMVNQNPTASAGGNQTICETGTATVSGATFSNGTILWSHNGTGSLTDATTLTPTYIAAAGDAGNAVILTMTVSNSPCMAATAIYTVNVDASPIGGSVSGGTAICSGTTSGVLTLSGYTGTIVGWESSVSPFSVWTPIVNTNATYTSGALTETTQFRAVVHNGVCVVASTATTVVIDIVTWNGTAWSNITGPTSATAAVISGNYALAANIDACTLTVTSGTVLIPSGYNVTLNGALTVSGGTFTLDNNANLIQSTSVTNVGSIAVKRDSNALSRLDYTMWSSPVSGQQLQAFSPATLADRFYTYNPTTNLYETISPNPVTVDFATATGYLIRMPNNAVTAPATQIFNGVFTGTPNNGPVSISVASGTYNAVGNPYPSTINADLFMSGNGITSGADALYFWRKINGATGSSYATYTTAGGTASPSSAVPNGIIQVGQGFIAKSTGTSLVFNNSMRVGNNANQFFKTTIDKSRIWLNLTNTNGFEGQMMLAYMDGATTGIDAGIEGKYFNDSQTALTSIINAQEFVIQGRPLPFVTTDVVPLSFKSLAAGTFTIAIDHVDGLFANGQIVYLKDNLMNTTHNLTSGAYTFATEAGVFNTRFEIVYQTVLAVNEMVFNENSVIVYQKDDKININSGSVIMDNVKIFDISGRLLIEKSKIDTAQVIINGSKFANQLLLIQITTHDGLKVTKKVIN